MGYFWNFFLCGIYPLIHSLVNLEKKNIFWRKRSPGMTRDKMGECESASRHPRMATRLSNEQNGAETERERELVIGSISKVKT